VEPSGLGSLTAYDGLFRLWATDVGYIALRPGGGCWRCGVLRSDERLIGSAADITHGTPRLG